MNMLNIKSLFTLFSSEEDVTKYLPLIESSLDLLRRKIKKGADSTDVRLDYLCAAIANFRYTQITCVKNKVAYTYAGTADSEGNSQLEYDFSRELMNEYFRAAAELLVDSEFVFASISDGGDYSGTA